ncbi:hypothetical protein DTO027B5_7334 [Paecilomyces variotii]|nr:hypothetical protein DTO027B3_2076 [Paecilomyces variotii]KAJ9330907.1 hypothetical protein DTO027B5_7334 [Paecilomyces variotii]
MAPSLPKATTLLSWFFYLIPVYLFVLAPLFQFIFPEWDNSRAAGGNNNELGGYNYEDGVDDYEGEYSTPLHLADDRFISLEDDVPFACPEQEGRYKVHIFSRVPLVIYIEGFLSEDEAEHLVRVSEGKYAPSIIYDGVSERVDPSVRRSDRALLDRDDVVRCLEERARSFQGWRPGMYIERMWAQRYNVSGHYQNHYDWTGNLRAGGDRVSTFMVYLQADCTGGGTNFPRMKMPREKKWCRFLECDEEGKGEEGHAAKEVGGVTFKPIKGNAIFWENLRADGTGYPETWHAALPVTSGSKVGLNIWSWYQPPRRTKGKKE